MFRDRRSESNVGYWVVGGGAVLGLAVGVILARRSLRSARGLLAPGALDRLEARVDAALEEEGLLTRVDIQVGALSDGIVELTGSVRDEEEAARVVAVVQRVPGVRTVLNRMDTEILEEHLADSRRRNAERGPGARGSHWYGNRVGMGMRRQGHETDPGRPDDKTSIVSRKLGVDRAGELSSEELEKVAPGVEGHTIPTAGPADRGTVDETSHRRLGNVPAEPIQEMNPGSRIHENVKKGTELTLEESGLERELVERDLKDRS